jgi:hypothetical protein
MAVVPNLERSLLNQSYRINPSSITILSKGHQKENSLPVQITPPMAKALPKAGLF